VDVRRSSRADGAANSDVVITGDPLLERLWLELQDARDPTPLAKLQQAERDIDLAQRASDRLDRLPVVIWHRIRERSHQVTTRLWVVDEFRGVSAHSRTAVVTLDLQAVLELVGRHGDPTPERA